MDALYAVFCWTFVPAIIASVGMFLMPKRVKDYNSRKALEFVAQIKSMRRQP
jgi:hypothetical protein